MLLQQFQDCPALWISSATFLSLLIGSFLNVVILRLPKAMEHQWKQECRMLLALDEPSESLTRPALAAIAWPNSHCPSCKTPLKAWHNIPLISYLLLKGRCEFCNLPISPLYPMVELLTAVLGLAVAWVLGPNWQGVASLVLVYILVAMAFIDLDHKLLPDQLTLPLMWLGLAINASGIFTSLQDAFWGAVAGYMSLWLVYWGFRLATGKHGMGYGDFKLLAALGAWMGWQALPMIVLMAAVAGIVVGLVLRLRKTPTDPQMPFGPYLAVGGLAYLLCGQQIWGLLNAVF
ncbi:MAG: A24 family peptidase [Oceanospirillaceae bacterium]|jgi:leader peptidase (prepilin peptidase)/N-methyltransferase|nr:A24 family peptidase [Oceanospirillaceae bacterium]